MTRFGFFVSHSVRPEASADAHIWRGKVTASVEQRDQRRALENASNIEKQHAVGIDLLQEQEAGGAQGPVRPEASREPPAMPQAYSAWDLFRPRFSAAVTKDSQKRCTSAAVKLSPRPYRSCPMETTCASSLHSWRSDSRPAGTATKIVCLRH